MRLLLFNILFLIFLRNSTVLGQNIPSKFEFGLYAVYLDQSTYSELTINMDGTFKYLTRDFLGMGSSYKGQWKIKKRKLKLLISEKDDLFRPLPRKWKIQEKELCVILNKKRTGQCLTLNGQ